MAFLFDGKIIRKENEHRQEEKNRKARG